MNVEGQAAIVTGGHSGMGFGAARALAAKGAKVTILGRRVERVKEKAEELGVLGIACDVADPDAIDSALDTAEKAHGTARILIHAAANGGMLMLLNPDGSPAPTRPIRDMISTNLLGTLFIDRAFASRLTKAAPLDDGLRGVIVNVSSISAVDGVVGTTYAASKGGVDAVCLSLARELAAWRIRVCTVSPGGIDTEMLREGAVEATYEMIKSQVPGLQRLGTPEEFGALALHLCENDYLNAVNIRLDGGMRIPFTYDLGGGAKRPNV